MAVYASIEELKNAINETIYANDAGLVTAEVLQERMHDIIDTLNSLGGSGDLSALESANDLAQIYAGNNKVATEAWVGEQAFLTGGEFIASTEKGAVNGVAELDGTGKVPLEQLPDYIDDGVIGDRLYAENNILTDSETLTASLDKLDKAVVLKTKVIEIGDWDMDATASVSIGHGLNYSTIRSVKVFIRSDAIMTILASLEQVNPSTGVAAGSVYINGTGVVMERVDGGTFDSNTFDTTSYNRGWITIQYVP